MSFNHKEYIRALGENYRNRLGWSQDVAQEAARIASDVLRAHYGGERHYIAARAVDDARIREEYTGRNIAELARRHGISAATVRRIISR